MASSLFSGRDLRELLESRLGELRERVLGLGVATLNSDELAGSLIDEFLVESPELKRADLWAPEARDVKVDVRHDQMRHVRDRSRPAMIAGTRIEFHVPVDGDPDFFRHSPNSFSPVDARGEIHGRELVVAREVPADSMDGARIRKELEGDIDLVERRLESIRVMCSEYNDKVRSSVPSLLDRRREKLAADRSLEESLGVPIRRRPDASTSLAVDVPKKRRAIPVAKPSKDRAPEASISDDDFGLLIDALDAFGHAVERFPGTFAPMEEEVLRELVLVVLNNQFGPAVGEMFSRVGKTDVAIIHDKGPVFIAECKFYDGPKSVVRALNQLLGYLVWRDTKAALLLFVRRRDVTKAVEDACGAIRIHERYRSDGPPIAGHPLFRLVHEGDEARTIDVVLVAVPIPEPG